MSSTSIKKSAILNVLGRYSSAIINLVYSAILSRILTPEEFGTVAIIYVFTTFFTLFANMGIGPAIIQNKNIVNDDLKTIFAFTFYLSILITLVFIVVSLPIAFFYDNKEYIIIGSLLSISIFFTTLNIVPNAILLKNHKFKNVTFRFIIVSLLSAIPTIIFAFIGFGYYSVVIHSILVALLTFLWNVLSTESIFSLKIKKESILKISEFSKYQYAFSIINYFSRNLDNILIGRIFGDVDLGYYSRSYQLMKYPIQYLTHAISPVLHPILSNYSEQKVKLLNKYIKVLQLLSITGVFVTVLFYYSAEEILLLLFGNQWTESVKSLKFLSLSIWVQMLTSTTGSIFQSLNRSKLLFVSGLISTLIIISSIVVGIVLGDLNMVALMVSIGYIIVFLESFYILFKLGFAVKFRNFINIVYYDFINLILMFFYGYIITYFFVFQSLFLSLVFKILILGFGYICILIISKRYIIIVGALKFR